MSPSPSTTSERDGPAGATSLKTTRLVFALCLVAFAIRVLFLLLSANNGGDALDRVAKTEEWIESPRLQFFYGAWMPLHFWLMGALSMLFGNVELAGRLLSLVTGCGSVWLVWRIARRAFGEEAGLLSLCVMVFYTVHVGYSTTSSAEVPFLFFSLLGLDWLLEGKESGAWPKLAVSGLCFTLSAAIRYEAWVLMAGAGLLLIGSPQSLLHRAAWSRSRLSQLAAFGLTAGAWPLFWMTYCYVHLGHPLYYVAMQREWVPGINIGTSLLYRLSVSPVALLLGLSAIGILGAGYALWLALRDPRPRPLAFLYLFFATVQFYQIVTEGMWPSARFTVAQGVLLALLAGYGLERLARQFLPRWTTPRVCAVLALFLLSNLCAVWMLSEIRHPYSDKIGSVSPRLRFNHYLQDVGDFLRPRLRPGEPVVFDNYNVESALLAVASGMPVRPGEHVFLAVKRKPEELQTFLETRRPRYLVYSPAGVLRRALTLPGDCSSATVWGVGFRCVFQNQTYSIFELNYP